MSRNEILAGVQQMKTTDMGVGGKAPFEQLSVVTQKADKLISGERKGLREQALQDAGSPDETKRTRIERRVLEQVDFAHSIHASVATSLLPKESRKVDWDTSSGKPADGKISITQARETFERTRPDVDARALFDKAVDGVEMLNQSRADIRSAQDARKPAGFVTLDTALSQASAHTGTLAYTADAFVKRETGKLGNLDDEGFGRLVEGMSHRGVGNHRLPHKVLEADVRSAATFRPFKRTVGEQLSRR